MKRIIHIDAVKVIASFMIVVYHFTEYGFIDFGFTVGKDYIPGLGKCFLGLCSAGVPLFFLSAESLQEKNTMVFANSSKGY